MKLATFQCQLARFTPSGEPRYNATRTICGDTRRWNNLSAFELSALQKFFAEDIQQTGREYVSRMREVAAA